MISSNCWPAGVVWKYDRVEMIADGIVHAIGVSLGLVGAITIFVVAAHSLRTAEIASIAVYSVGLLSMLVSQPPTIYGRLRARSGFCAASITPQFS